MGWNSGYTIYEQQVITLYNNNVLTKTILESIMEPFKGTDIDHGGSRNLTSKDGLSADEIVCKIYEPERYLEAIKNPEWEDGEPGDWNTNIKLYNLFEEIWRKQWKCW